MSTFTEILGVFLRLGCTSFGGPAAHIGYFHNEFVVRRGWILESEFADLIALCQSLPGPASSQTGFAIGLKRRGILGGVAAWLGFTLPSAILMVLVAFGFEWFRTPLASGLLKGFQLVAVAIVAQAVWQMAKRMSRGLKRASITLLSAIVILWIPNPLAQIAVIAGSGFAGYLLLREGADNPAQPAGFGVSRRVSNVALVLFFALLAGLPAVLHFWNVQGLRLFYAFYRTGALVFGGGHVLLPLLVQATVTPGWITLDRCLGGYGAAQAMPGPLSTFAAFAGAAVGPEPHGILGAAIALVAIFLPGILVLLGALNYWDRWRSGTSLAAALAGINACVVGILLAALYSPVWTTSVRGRADFLIALGAFLCLTAGKLPPWLVVIAGGIVAAAGFKSS